MQPKIRVAIFEDNDNLRSSLELVLGGRQEMICTGAFPDCSSLNAKISVSRPDVILMDIDMPGMNGIEAVAEIAKLAPDALVIMQTVFDDENRILKAICAGAKGYILKGYSADGIVDAINEVQCGGSPMSPGIARKVTGLLFNTSVQAAKASDIQLTSREQEVLQLLVNGKSYKMIADSLQIAIPTVNTHIRKIYEKLQVNSIQEAVSAAFRKGLV